MSPLERLISSVADALATAAPVLVGALVPVIVYWLRVRKARLRAERQMLPPSSEPPRPSWWQSIRPRQLRRRRAPAELETPIELEPRDADPEIAAALEREIERVRVRDTRVGSVDDFDHEPTPPRGRRRS